MKSFVKHIVEPARLLLAWQPSDAHRRRRYIVGEITRNRDDVTLTYLRDSSDFNKAKECGFDGYPAFKKTDNDYSIGVIDAFMRRLPPRSRGDFEKYLDLLRIPVDTVISDFALLGYSGAKLPSDGFSIIHPFDNVCGPCEFLLEVAGFRYVNNVSIEDIASGDEAVFVPEPENEYDPRAVRIEIDNKKIGYVNRGQVEAMHRWIRDEYIIHAFVERLNGSQERPMVYLYVEILPAPLVAQTG